MLGPALAAPGRRTCHGREGARTPGRQRAREHPWAAARRPDRTAGQAEERVPLVGTAAQPAGRTAEARADWCDGDHWDRAARPARGNGTCCSRPWARPGLKAS